MAVASGAGCRRSCNANDRSRAARARSGCSTQRMWRRRSGELVQALQSGSDRPDRTAIGRGGARRLRWPKPLRSGTAPCPRRSAARSTRIAARGQRPVYRSRMPQGSKRAVGLLGHLRRGRGVRPIDCFERGQPRGSIQASCGSVRFARGAEKAGPARQRAEPVAPAACVLESEP